MVQITNGTIGYSRVKKDEDFGINRKGEASLSWSVEDGESPSQVKLHIEQIEQTVFDIAHRLLTKQFTAARAAEQKAGPEAGVKSGAVPPPAPATPTGPAPTNDKEKLAAEAGVGTDAREALEKKTAAQFGQNAKPPRAPKKSKEAPAPETPAPAAVIEDDDPLGLGIVVPEPAAEPVTDAELGSATVARNKAIQKPDAIRALIAEFAGAPPKQARDIPQDKRHAYLEKLKTLS
jgi:hypothetical protein